MGRVCAEDEKPPDLPPEVAGKVKNFLKKITDAQRKHLDEKMDKLIAEVAKATALKEEGVKALRSAAAKAEDAEQSEMGELMLKAFAKEYAENKDAALAPLDQPEIIQMAATEDIPDSPDDHWTRADEQPAWKNALAKTLTPEQAAAWEKSKLPEATATQKAIDAFLDAETETMRARAGGTVSTLAADLIASLALPKERADAVNALAKKATDESLAVMRKATTETLLKYNKAARDNVLNNNRGNFFVSTDHPAEQQAVWKDGLAALLTDAERAQLKTVAESHRIRRAQALGTLLIQLLDERLAFTEEQRTQLQPIAERIVQNQKKLFPERGEQSYYRYERGTFYKATQEARPEEVRPLLDETQWKRWQGLASSSNADDDDEIVRVEPPAAAPDKAPAAPGEPEDLEAAVADYLVAQSDKQFKGNSDTMLLQVEDLRRVAQVGAGAMARLHTAALGAAEAATGTWLANTESSLRGELQNATAENIQQRLANMSRYGFMRVDLEDNPVWKTALSAEVTPDQFKAWQTQRDAREDFKARAIAIFVEAELDRKISLTRDQWDKLGALLRQTIQEYALDMRSMFSYRSYPWYLQSYSLYLPLHAIPDNDLKAILTPEQFTAWTGSQECGYSANYWNSLRNNHERRVKQKKG